MNKKEKLVKRFRTLPKDFTFEEVESLFQGYGFELANKGATSGSRIKFFKMRRIKTHTSCINPIQATL
jgi:hypothetical protein